MPKAILPSHWRIPAVIAVCVLVSGLSSAAFSKDGERLLIGGISVPQLRGWKQERYKGASLSSLNFKRTVSGRSVTIKVMHTKTPPGVQPPDAESLTNDEARRHKTFSEMSRAGGSLSRYETVTSRATRFKGKPAYYVVFREIMVGRPASQTRALSFTDGRDHYTLGLGWDQARAMPDLKKEVEGAWKTIYDGIRINPNSRANSGKSKTPAPADAKRRRG